MRFSVTFPGSDEQATYPQDLINLMGRMRAGENISALQLRRFPFLESVGSMAGAFPTFDPEGFAIMHDIRRDEIVVRPAHPWALTDAPGFAFALRGMLGRFERHTDVVSFPLVAEGDIPKPAANAPDVLICTSYAWEILPEKEAEAQLRRMADQRMEDARSQELAEREFSHDDNSMSLG